MVMESVSMPGSASKPLGNQLVSPESATASSLFDQFVQAQTIKAILSTFRYMCEILRIKPTNFPNFYPKLKAKVKSWKAQSLWTKFDKRASHKSYSKGKACANTRVLIIGAGPCGLRAAIEAQLLGAKVVVVEKRDRLTRNNVLHLWPFVIHDLRNLGAKKFFGKFCAGTIDHISIRQLQCILLKVALLLGVEIHESVSFDDLVEPCTNESQEKTGWRALVTPRDHPVSQYEFDVLIGADGKRNTLKGFKRKEFRGKLAIAITANFVNRRTEDEARVEEISGVAFIFNQKFFQELRDQTGIDLENIVYYKDDTHYFVMTAKKTSLLEKGVIIKDYADTVRLLANENVCREALLDYAREAADFSTHFQLPHLDFAVNCQGLADVAMFDFTSMFQAENACRIVERKGYKLLQALVGDSLLEPFWPTGSGCARGFLSSMDTCWMIRSWSLGKMTQTEVLAERESIYRLLAQTTPENLSKVYNEHALDPHSRYPNLNTLAVRPAQVRHLYDSDVELKDEILEVTDVPRRKRKRDSFIHPDTLLNWCQRQIALYSVTVTDLCTSWKNGLALCAIIHRYRPDLINFDSLNEEEAAKNNQLAFDICDREFGIHPVMTGKEMADCDVPDKLTMMSYISQIYDTFRGDIPHIARNLVDMSPEERPASPTRKPMGNRLNILTRLNQKVGSRKRHSSDTLERQEKSAVGRIPDIENDQRLASGAVLEAFRERTLENSRKSRKRRSLERDRALFILNKDMKNPTSGGPHKADLLYVDKKDFNSRVRDLEEKLCRGTTRSDNLSTSPGAKVGRIDRSDWNVKMLEERMKGQNNPKRNREDVPLYNRDIFEDKLKAMDSKLHRNGTEEEPSKFNEFDTTLKKLDLKLKEGNNLDTGLKGSNKVSAMAEQLASFLEPKVEHVPLQRTGARPCMIDPQGGSENCHFCGKRVYLMERQSAQGKFFHRGCFKCECCGTSLRLGSYGIDAEGLYSGKFLCMQHFGLGFFLRKRSAQDGEEAKGNAPYEAVNPLCSTPQQGSHYAERLAAAHAAHRASAASSLEVPDSVPDYTRGVTPERVEFENTLELISEDELLSEIDEDEWTDRNFGTSTTEIDSSDEESDFSDEEIYPEDEEKLEEAVRPLTADETRRLAESWKRRYSKDRVLDSDEDDDRSDSDEEYAESNDEFSYEECLSDEQGSTPTECGNDKPILKGPEKREEYDRQDSQEDSGTEDDTEVFSGAGSNGEVSESESELEDDELAATHSIPTIVIDESPQNATNEDDEEYFHSLKEQSMQAEKALSDMRSNAEIETVFTQNAEEETVPVEPVTCDDALTPTEVADELIIENTCAAAVEEPKDCYSPDADLESVITDKEPIARSLGSLEGCSGVEIAQRRNSVESASSLPDLAKISVQPMPPPARSGSTDSPRAKMMLELKEKYLLGSTGSPEGASKEDTHHQSAEHQPVMKSIMDLISQKQKMLNPPVTLATSEVKREIPGLLSTLYSSSNLNAGVANSSTLSEIPVVSEPSNEGLQQVDEVQKEVAVEECFIEQQPELVVKAGESKLGVVSDRIDKVNGGEDASDPQNETNGHVESPEHQFPSERDTDLDVDSGEIVTEPLGGGEEEDLEDSQLDERFITVRKKKKIVDPDASNADVQSTVFTATLIQTGSVDSLDVLESDKPPSKSEGVDTSQIGPETPEQTTNTVVQSSDSEEDKIWSEKDSDLIDSMSKDLSESMEGDMLGSLPGSNDGRDNQQTSAPRYEGSNFRRFSEKTGPFGGMRDSIDIRKSAQRRRPPLFRGESAGSILDPRSSVELKEAEADKVDKVVLRRRQNAGDETKNNNRNSVHDNLDEIPFVDDESNGQEKLKEKLNWNKSDVYRRPPLQRPMSLVEKSSTSPVMSPKRALLLDTPLTNPNIGQTPISMSVAIENIRMMRTVERERAREEARNRARMKTDEELGIRSPTDFSNLKKKWHRQDSKVSDSDSKDGSSLATSPSEELPSEPSPIPIASFSPSSPKELLFPSQSSSSIVTPVSDLTPDDANRSLESSSVAVTPTSPSEHTAEISVDDVELDMDVSPLPQPPPPAPMVDVPIETEIEQQSPPVLPPKSRTSAPVKDTEKQSEKSHKQPKEKKSSIFSRLAAGLGKSESSKSKSKEKEEKSPQGSSTLADLPIKVDGAPKESRFPKLRLNRSKEKAKEKRRQKSIEGSGNAIKDREDSFSSLKTTSSEERDETRSRERTPSSVEAGEGFSPVKDVERNGISPLRPKEQDIVAPVIVKEPEAKEEKQIDDQSVSYERNKVSPRPILDRQSLIQSMISLSQSPATSSNKFENGVAPKATGDSFSDPDEDGLDEKSQASTSSGGRKPKDPGLEKRRKLQRIAQRLYRQQEQKRLRKAQEIQRELEELEVKLKELEEQGVEVERALRGENADCDKKKEEPELMQDWFHLVHDKNVLMRQEQELMVKAKELELEDRHNRLQKDLYERMAIDNSKKSEEQLEEEERILAEMLETVEQRDALIAMLDEDRQRHQEEDQNLERNLRMSGLNFTPKSKT